MARWTDGKLDLGALGNIKLFQWMGPSRPWTWTWCFRSEIHSGRYPTAARARSAAESWLRRALKQAGKRLEVKP